ncbi:hypothetical protein FRC07_004606 [Ceratobasidium sp. 392]|nr:hypothetical protein FRC07_004606 [Ceratobasidium sp. 392]
MHIRHEGVLGKLMNWYSIFVILRDRVLPEAAAFDVFLDCSSEDACRYYLIDHGNKTICWLRRRTTSDLGVSDVCNVLHLRALLNEEYWTHAEYMPKDENHLASSRAELQATLASSMLDHMTSEGSTTPFTTEECNAYLLALEKAAESGFMIYLNWSIVHSRNVNLYGQSGTWPDRTTTAEGRQTLARPSSSETLKESSDIQHDSLENIWAGRITHTHHCRDLLTDSPDQPASTQHPVQPSSPHFISISLEGGNENAGRSNKQGHSVVGQCKTRIGRTAIPRDRHYLARATSHPYRSASSTGNASNKTTQSNHDEAFAKHPSSGTEAVIPRTKTIIKSNLPIDEVMQRLIEHGCHDVTNNLDLGSISQDPVACGGLGNVYLAKLQSGLEVAVKCLSTLRNLDTSDQSSKLLKV